MRTLCLRSWWRATLISGLVTSLALALPVVTPLAAQSLPPVDIGGVYNASGFLFGVTVHGAALREVGSTEADAGGGFALRLGYGFGDHVDVFVQGAVASMTLGSRTAGQQTLFQGDLGTRFQLLPGRATVPYLEVAFSGRQYTLPWGFSEDLHVRGVAATAGAGFEFYLARTVAVDLGIAASHGTFSRGRHPGGMWETLDGGAITATSARGGLGLVWHP
jgi:hypothetical protein